MKRYLQTIGSLLWLFTCMALLIGTVATVQFYGPLAGLGVFIAFLLTLGGLLTYLV